MVTINYNQLAYNRYNRHFKCHFCQGNHRCRNCPIEEQIAPILKKKVGIIMEKFIGKYYNCPKCNGELNVIGTHSPSRDIKCNDCGRFFEVKSKCLSVDKIPKDLYLPHGNYNKYIERTKEGLDFIIIIYKVDRKKKCSLIREILYIDNKVRKMKNIIKVNPRKTRSGNILSTIIIENRLDSNIKLLSLKNKNCIFNFKKIIENIIYNLKNHNS